MDIDVEVGDWEHSCCGGAVERGDVVDLDCIRWTDPDGRLHLVETHHDLDVGDRQRVRGRVVDIQVVEQGGVRREILRLPSGPALRGFDPHDDGHLEDPWSGDVITTSSSDFVLTVRTAR